MRLIFLQILPREIENIVTSNSDFGDPLDDSNLGLSASNLDPELRAPPDTSTAGAIVTGGTQLIFLVGPEASSPARRCRVAGV